MNRIDTTGSVGNQMIGTDIDVILNLNKINMFDNYGSNMHCRGGKSRYIFIQYVILMESFEL